MNEPTHLVPTKSDRGFTRLPPIIGNYGGDAQVYESSGASRPLVWLAVRESPEGTRPRGGPAEVSVHLTADDAWRLADQLRWLVEHHYQGNARPAWASPDA